MSRSKHGVPEILSRCRPYVDARTFEMDRMLGSELTSRKSNVATFFAAAAVAAATLWDIRLLDLRLFDGIALGCLGVYLILAPEPRADFVQRRRSYWILFSVIIFMPPLDMSFTPIAPRSAIAALAIVGFVTIGRRDWLDSAAPLCCGRLRARICCFSCIQFGAFYGFHYVIDYQATIGAHRASCASQPYARGRPLPRAQ